MPYICERELLNIYESLEPILKRQGFASEIVLIRDYLMKIKIAENGKDLGKLIVDYSPKKGTHNFRKDTDLDENQYQHILKSLGVTQTAKNPVSAEKKQTVEKNKYPSLLVQNNRDVSIIDHHAYVDCSFIDGRVGYGAVILKDGNVVAEISGLVDTEDAFSSRQVGGEIQAVIETLKWCKNNNIDEIAIFYDFQNIEKWATGEYKTNTPMTKGYKKAIDECGISINWVKVKSHTGVAYNDRADELAKNGARKLYSINQKQGQSQPEQMSLFESSKKAFRGWIIYNGSILTPKFTEQVDWFIKSARKFDIELTPYKNDDLGAAIIDGEYKLINNTEKPDFVLFWDKDVRLARQLEHMGLKLFNSSEAIMNCDDKIVTHQTLANHGIAMPKTIISPLVFPGCKVDELLFIEKIEKTLAYPMVVKEAFGSFGAQVYMAKNKDELIALRKKLICVPHVYQEYISTSHGRDVRLQVVGDEVVAAMLRTSDTDFRAHISAGGRMMPFVPTKPFCDMAIKAKKIVGADFAGVDILFGPSDTPILCEINSNAHMKNIFDCTNVNVADKIMQYIKMKL